MVEEILNKRRSKDLLNFNRLLNGDNLKNEFLSPLALLIKLN